MDNGKTVSNSATNKHTHTHSRYLSVLTHFKAPLPAQPITWLPAPGIPIATVTMRSCGWSRRCSVLVVTRVRVETWRKRRRGRWGWRRSRRGRRKRERKEKEKCQLFFLPVISFDIDESSSIHPTFIFTSPFLHPSFIQPTAWMCREPGRQSLYVVRVSSTLLSREQIRHYTAVTVTMVPALNRMSCQQHNIMEVHSSISRSRNNRLVGTLLWATTKQKYLNLREKKLWVLMHHITWQMRLLMYMSCLKATDRQRLWQH